ncbi:hypothetical protein [Legionella maioricensis]|uniref:Substrate of the Dot/Icm secretion system n=1 Tax=Legionella maioricensis TaxID=2896528 RepID=A0A9X2IBS8_9GAMM|nr:hypothetical protein [Legionella maioricensis]MCL9685159.1 hypothetical protein [Legionella maioricensis]MCL9688328.1 hypothetical protein [Legionella maioricensis]
MKAKRTLPPNLKEILLDAMSVAETSIEAAHYLAVQFKQLLTDAKMLEQCDDIMRKVQDFAKYTEFKLLSSSQPWLGQMAENSAFKNMQANMATEAAKKLESFGLGAGKEISFDFAVNEQTSEFRRGSSEGGKALPSSAVDSVDIAFNAWLAEKNIRSVESALYETTPDGKVKLDAQGKQVKANPEEVTKLINDPEQGFAKYMEAKGIKVSCHEQEFPTAEKDIKAQQALKEAIKAAPTANVPETTPGEAVEPQTTMRTGG